MMSQSQNTPQTTRDGLVERFEQCQATLPAFLQVVLRVTSNAGSTTAVRIHNTLYMIVDSQRISRVLPTASHKTLPDWVIL
jgi:hypothetical protein